MTSSSARSSPRGGATTATAPSVVWRDRREPEEAATIVSQVFLGIRLECAKCHHHPFESWGQEQFYEFAAYFARVGHKGAAIAPPIAAGEETVFLKKSGAVKHPLTGQVLPPKPLFGSAPPPTTPTPTPARPWPPGSPRRRNPYFSRVIVNRTWAELMGRGIVEPVDDLRATNPPSNGPLLDALADDFVAHGYDLKHLIRTIMTSAAYGLSSDPTDRNVADTRNFSRHYRQRPRAEVLLDAIVDITGVPETARRRPARHPRRRELDDPEHLAVPRHLRPPRPQPGPPLRADARHLGRPGPPPDERPRHQPQDHRRRRPGRQARRLGPAARQGRRGTVPPRLQPHARPRRNGLRRRPVRRAGRRRRAVEDLTWALINSPEFVFED